MPAISERWDAAAIADGILTWHMWPGFQGVHCDECGCEMNVMGMSYGHRCPDCDPDGERHTMHSMCDCGRMPFDEPRFGPTQETLRAASQLAMDISEGKRAYPVGTRVMLHDYWYGHGRKDYPVMTGIIVEWDVEDSYPGMRYYRIDVAGGQKFKLVPESNIASFRKFDDGAVVAVRHRDWWVPARIVGLANKDEEALVYGRHWYEVELLGETGMSVNGAETASSMVHKSVFNGRVREEDIATAVPGTGERIYWNPNCRWCGGTGRVTLASSTRQCLDCWPERIARERRRTPLEPPPAAGAIPASEYIAVPQATGYGGWVVSAESLGRHHGGQSAFAAWWEENRTRLDGEHRFVAVLPGEVVGIFVEDYLDWVGASAESEGGDWVAQTNAERDRGLEKIFFG